MVKKSKIPTIIGIIILLAGVIAGVFFLNAAQVFKIGADALATPKDIRVTNVTDVSTTISWTTDKATSDFIVWGNGQNSVDKVEKESESDQKFSVHSITLTGLTQNSPYFYKINSDGVNYDNNGVPWQFTTGPSLNISQNSTTVSGSVLNPSGSPESHALVYITVNGYPASTLTSDSGNFVYQLGGIRTPDLSGYAKIDPAKTLLGISISAAGGNTSSVQIFPQSANPIPPIVLGQVYDLRSLAPNSSSQAPNANLSLPQNSTPESKFDVASSSASPAPTSVILESLKEGETVTSTTPQFFGKGPGGENITITVHSENPVSETVQIPKSGSWSWSPPSGLAPGAHTITISWIDTTGITRSLTRDFVVQAGELPAFVATPSQTLAPSSSASPSSTPKATPTVKPTSSATASAAPVPVTGDLTPTLLMFIMGIAVMLFSFVVWKISEN